MPLRHISSMGLITLALWMLINVAASWPLDKNTTVVRLPMKLLKSSMVPSTTKSNDLKQRIVRLIENDKKASMVVGDGGGGGGGGPFSANFHRLPPSPANLLKPDRFQFYTYNERGDMITKQMTIQEIQALIAGGGPDHSNANPEAQQEPQKVEDILTGGKKVMDVVEKVQNVLKSAMGKPTAATLTGSLPTVPEKANVEWSNILPAILAAGDKYAGDKFEESHYTEVAKSTTSTTLLTADQQLNFIPESFKPNKTEQGAGVVSTEERFESTMRNEVMAAATTTIGQTDKKETLEILSTAVPLTETVTAAVSSTEKLMILVPVITTAGENVLIGQRITQSPVFQKITEIAVVPLKNDDAFDQSSNYKEKNRPASTVNYATTTPTPTPLFLESTTKDINNYDITELVTSSNSSFVESVVADSMNESWVNRLDEPAARRNASLPIESKITTTPTTPTPTFVHLSTSDRSTPSIMYKVRPNLDTKNDSKIDPSASLPPEPNKMVTTLLTNDESFATTLPSYSLTTFNTTGDKFFAAPLATASLLTNHSDLDSTQTPPSKPLSIELVNSLSSVINQVSETVSSVLPISSGFQSSSVIGNSHYENVDNVEKKRNNVSEISSNAAAASIINSSTKFPLIHEERRPTTDAGNHVFAADTTSNIQSDDEQSSSSTMSSSSSSSFSDTAANLIRDANKHSNVSTRWSAVNPAMPSSLLIVTAESNEERVTTSPSSSSSSSSSSSAPYSSNTSLENWSKINVTNTKINGNWTMKPGAAVAIVDNILGTLSTVVNSAVYHEALTLPPPPLSTIIWPKNSSINTLASGLIAGFGPLGSNETTPTNSTGGGPAPFQSNISSATSSNVEISSTRETNEETNAPKMTEKNDYWIKWKETGGENMYLHKETQMQSIPSSSPVTRSTGEYSEGELDLSSTTSPSMVATHEYSELASSTASTSASMSALVASDSFATNSVLQAVTTEDNDTLLRTDSIESTVSKITPQVVASETTDWTDTNNPTETSSTKVVMEREKELVETSTCWNASTSIANSPPSQTSSSLSSKEEYAEEPYAEANSSDSTGGGNDNTITKSSSLLGTSDRQTNKTIITATQNWTVPVDDDDNNERIQSNLTKAMVGSTLATTTTTLPTTIIASNASKKESNHAMDTTDDDDDRTTSNGEQSNNNNKKKKKKKPTPSPIFGSTKLNGPKNQTTKQSNESLESLNSNNSSKRNVSSTAEHSEHTWQRISLHQATPLFSTTFVSPSLTSSSMSTSTTTTTTTTTTTKEEWRTKAIENAETTSESTTMTARIEFDSTEEKEKEKGSTSSMTTPSMTTPATTTTTVALNASKIIEGLDISTRNASSDIINFSRLCNELAFKFWIAVNSNHGGSSSGRSLVVSPFGMISLLAMIFLGARGSTSDQMNEVLGLDNVATFNPHLIFQNVTDTVSLARHQGIANAAFVRELFADKAKVRKLLPFYKEQAQQFYEGLVVEVNFATISDLARRRTNLLIRKQTGGRIKDFAKNNAIPLRSPLAAISANVFQTECNASTISAIGRDGELYFAVSSVATSAAHSSAHSSAHRLRKLIPVPAVVWRSNVLAGYEPNLDATAIAVGGVANIVSTIFLLPGQQGHVVAPGDTLDRLEQRLVKGAFRDGIGGGDTWNKLLKVLIPRTGLELQIPKFTHRSIVNATAALKRMGLDQLFSSYADFKGINGIGNRLFLSDVLQMNLFGTCGDENIANGRHHVEIYPASSSSRFLRQEEATKAKESSIREREEISQRDDHGSTTTMPGVTSPPTTTTTTTRNDERSRDKPRLKLDQPFLYFVRHNPTGLILHMGRFNPRSL